MEKYTALAAVTERLEEIGEQRGRDGLVPNHGDALTELLDVYPEACPLAGEDLDHLFMRYWMHYAAGLKHPEQPAEVTLAGWRGE